MSIRYRKLSFHDLCSELQKATYALDQGHGTYTNQDVEDIIDELARRQLGMDADDDDDAPWD